MPIMFLQILANLISLDLRGPSRSDHVNQQATRIYLLDLLTLYR